MTSQSTRSRRPVSAVLLAAALTLTACGGGSGGDVEAGGAVEGVDLSGVSISVGSKEFTEQLVLGQIAVQALRAAGANVEDKTNITGTSVVRAALVSGEIDVYYEYTGTGWITILGNTEPVPGADPQFEAVKEADAANNITWLARAEANNTFALAANGEAAEELGVASISDYARVVKEDPTAATLCSSAEFINRDDGLPGVERTYGFDLPADRVIQLEPALVYTQVGQRDPCNFAVVFATDGQVLNNELVVLEDDKMFFPPYNIAPTMRTEVYTPNAVAYDKLFGTIATELTDERLTALNAEVDVDGRRPADVAADFLTELGILAD
ncbi:MAG: glycine betaine ABC transporter substrate-binding protein [Actinobacteria bacterium]|nr:glycine betaine ABC transporter substrate-binding protein [Actinomycetota bacterium]MBW3647149.1 glycine betaine ABC transporter substrate-binding protein [Actinomycetota bacterium]